MQSMVYAHVHSAYRVRRLNDDWPPFAARRAIQWMSSRRHLEEESYIPDTTLDLETLMLYHLLHPPH
jgi:hypothetical protein